MNDERIYKPVKFSVSYKTLCVLGSCFITIVLVTFYMMVNAKQDHSSKSPSKFWVFSSIDTMKYSRDKARETLNQPLFNLTIDKQLSDIKATGANYVAIATPYDEEFYPILSRWVKLARKNHLKVWFRGNFSGWEGWFEYKKIDRSEHMRLTEQFLVNNLALFEDGDIFTACPECENGGPGDPRLTRDVTGHRKFLIDEYEITKKGFVKMNKKVASNYNSMNKDVAALIMDKKTTFAMGGLVTIDHYVASPEELSQDIEALARSSGGRILLGEFGAPIPDINGEMSEDQQAEWIKKAGIALVSSKYLEGVSYWTNSGGSTQLWNDNGSKRKAVGALAMIYNPNQLLITIKNSAGDSVNQAKISSSERFALSDARGEAVLPYLNSEQDIKIEADGYTTSIYKLQHIVANNTVVLEKVHESTLFKLKKVLKRLFTLI